MDLLDRAIAFATEAHAGMRRKRTDTPYILHPLEVAAIAGTMTSDREVLAAAVLHDTVEDTPTEPEEIRERFGERVASLVSSETEDKRRGVPPEESWQIRKEESLERLKNAADPGVKILWLSDKLSNMRSFARLRRRDGDGIWEHFNQKDPARQAWYYRSVADYTKELSDTDAWREYADLIKTVFEGVE